MAEPQGLLLAIVSSGLSTSAAVRLAQLALALERTSGLPLALVGGSAGYLRLLSGAEQLALKRASVRAESLTQAQIDFAPRVRLGTAESLGAGPDRRAHVVLGEGGTPGTAAQQRLAACFGACTTLGSAATPWPVACSNRDNTADARAGTLVLVGDTPCATLAARLAQVFREAEGPVTLFDLHDAYAADDALPHGIVRAGPRALAGRVQLFAAHRRVVYLGDDAAHEDLFFHEALALGLDAEAKAAVPQTMPLDDCARLLWARIAPPDACEAETIIERIAVGPNEVIVTTDFAALEAAWRAAPGEVALVVDGPANALTQLHPLLGELSVAEVYLESIRHAREAPRLLSQALGGMLRGRIAKSPELALCESVAVQAHRLRSFVAEQAAALRTALVWLPEPRAGSVAQWCAQASVAAERFARVGPGFEGRVLIADVGQPGEGQLAGDHRIGAMQASSDIAAGVREAAPGHLSLVGMLPPPFDKRMRRVFFEPGALLPARKQRLACAPAWYLHELAAALRERSVRALVNLNGPFMGGLHAARLAYSDYPLPLVGVLHSLHVAQLELDHLEVHLSEPLRPYDLLISPSHCGRRVMRNILQSVAERAARAGVPRPSHLPQIEVVPYGVETQVYGGRSRYASRINLGLPLRPLLVASVMRFARYNKADLAPLILSLKMLRDRGYDVELVLAGQINDSDEPRRLMTLATQLGVGEAMHVKTNLVAADKHQLLAAADVFVALSDNVQETFGVGVVEAMAAGLPIVANAWDGFAELVRDGETGLLVPTLWRQPSAEREVAAAIARHSQPGAGAFDLSEAVAVSPQELADKLGTLLGDAELRTRMGERAQTIARAEYDRTKQGEKMVALLEDAIAAARATPAQTPRELYVSPLGERFGHYPSDSPAETDLLAASPAARDPRVRQAMLDALYWAQTDASEREVDDALLHRLGDAGLGWADARRPNCDDARLLRALKYGLVSRINAAGEI